MQGRGRRAGVAGGPAALPLVTVALVLMARHAPLDEVARFAGFCIFGVTLPGFVLWRAIGRYRRNLVEDCAAGFAVGTAAQLLVYLACASVGWQRLSWLWAVPVVLLAVLNQGIRARVWRRVDDPLPTRTAWLLSVASGLTLVAVYRHGPHEFAPAYTDPSISYPDLAFHQALSASAKYDVPLSALWVAGEPMKYHSFFHHLTAATSWATGIDLTSLVYVLAWLPLTLAGTALVFALTQRFVTRPDRVGATWAGPLAAAVAGLGGTIQPLPATPLANVMASASAYLSPTQNLGVMFAVLLALLCVDLVRDGSWHSRWVLMIGIAVASAGAKATILSRSAASGSSSGSGCSVVAGPPPRFAGFAAMALTAQPAIGQMYFLITAFPVIAVLSCVGLTQVVERVGDHRGAALVAIAAPLGLAACPSPGSAPGA